MRRYLEIDMHPILLGQCQRMTTKSIPHKNGLGQHTELPSPIPPLAAPTSPKHHYHLLARTSNCVLLTPVFPGPSLSRCSVSMWYKNQVNYHDCPEERGVPWFPLCSLILLTLRRMVLHLRAKVAVRVGK